MTNIVKICLISQKKIISAHILTKKTKILTDPVFQKEFEQHQMGECIQLLEKSRIAYPVYGFLFDELHRI